MTSTAGYSVRRTEVDGIEVVQLSDSARGMQVSIALSVGNMAYEILAGGTNILWLPYRSPAELKSQPKLCGVPFLGPWANRLDGDGFWASGKRYLLNPGLGNLRRDAHQKPIHGVLNFSAAWVLDEANADGRSAWATSRLEFWRHPEMMAQFPFAHTVTMTHRLCGGHVEVETAIENFSTEPMPVAIGFHPYFQLADAARDDWKVHLAARDHLVLSDLLIPTGERRPVEFPDPHPLRAGPLDDVFGGLIRDADGRARFAVAGGQQRITVSFGPRYTVAVVYAPAGRDFVCFEPMSAITNAFNLAHSGIYQELQEIPAAGRWKESFWITPEGF
ncbi:MAG TPA: aldose 1-epimerase [Bryobacteraceae bacterium]|nr:aldose 1-epimerase [Bryobacteraceae bacterium]